MALDEPVKERLADNRSREPLYMSQDAKIGGLRDTSARNDRRFASCYH